MCFSFIFTKILQDFFSILLTLMFAAQFIQNSRHRTLLLSRKSNMFGWPLYVSTFIFCSFSKWTLKCFFFAVACKKIIVIFFYLQVKKISFYIKSFTQKDKLYIFDSWKKYHKLIFFIFFLLRIYLLLQTKHFYSFCCSSEGVGCCFLRKVCGLVMRCPHLHRKAICNK